MFVVYLYHSSSPRPERQVARLQAQRGQGQVASAARGLLLLLIHYPYYNYYY